MTNKRWEHSFFPVPVRVVKRFSRQGLVFPTINPGPNVLPKGQERRSPLLLIQMNFSSLILLGDHTSCKNLNSMAPFFSQRFTLNFSFQPREVLNPELFFGGQEGKSYLETSGIVCQGPHSIGSFWNHGQQCGQWSHQKQHLDRELQPLPWIHHHPGPYG